MRKGEVSQTIIVIGILALVAITVGMAYVSLDRINLPEDENQILRGNHLRISGGLAELADSCWRKSGQGGRSQVMDCFSARVYSNATVTASNISRDLELLPEGNFGMTGGPIPAKEVRLQVSYLPVEERVNISVIEVCRPSGGDTCYSTSCSCGTACAPGFDPDGDGDTETDAKGCVQSYSFEPSFNPCTSSSSLTCSDSSIYRSGKLENGYFTFDIGEKVGLRNVTVMEKSSNSFYGFKEADSDERSAPRDVVGYGSPQRKLFTGRGNISVSGLPDQEYAVFVWACDSDGGAPSNCRWLEPFTLDLS